MHAHHGVPGERTGEGIRPGRSVASPALRLLPTEEGTRAAEERAAREDLSQLFVVTDRSARDLRRAGNHWGNRC
ncbi:hypothetical protein PHYPO_G00111450 [Pangasianodon hypophthalmus]|uniref:Uncharacterized protein n=1 Tax=Pangasianodon hypophthalmus TaxID=310915 RepID=A0A5N5L276_PANHP|nr:hypothetical protein PHYPO_G00111450 [Pangasianodon hypophthalmus]